MNEANSPPDPPQAAAPVAARGPRLSWLASSLLAVTLTLLAAWAGVVLRFGSVDRGVAYLNGVRLNIEPQARSLGTVAPGSQVAVSFELVNIGFEPIQVLGSQVDCSCLAHDDRPFALPASGRRTFDMRMEMPHQDGPVERHLTLFTDVEGQRQVDLAITGTVAQPTQTASR